MCVVAVLREVAWLGFFHLRASGLRSRFNSFVCCEPRSCVCVRPNVAGLVLAGSAEFKTKLNSSEMFDQRLLPIVVKVVDVR